MESLKGRVPSEPYEITMGVSIDATKTSLMLITSNLNELKTNAKSFIENVGEKDGEVRGMILRRKIPDFDKSKVFDMKGGGGRDIW